MTDFIMFYISFALIFTIFLLTLIKDTGKYLENNGQKSVYLLNIFNL